MERVEDLCRRILTVTTPRHAAALSACSAVLLCGLVWNLSGGGEQLQPAVSSFGQPRLEGWWTAAHRALVSEVEREDKDQGWEVLFLGDSIMEALRGTELGGSACPRCHGVAEVYMRHVRSKYHSGVLAISGDQTAHLMFRITHGELPTRHRPRAVLLLIGTNDLGYAARTGGGETALLEAADAVVARVEAILHQLIYDLPGSRFALLGLLPRGSKDKGAGAPGGDAFALPSQFSAAIDRVNAGFRDIALRSRRVLYADCAGPLLLKEDGSGIDQALAPDALHPSAEGYERIFTGCWDDAIARLMY